MPSGTHYRACGIVLGMNQMNVILEKEHELSSLQIVLFYKLSTKIAGLDEHHLM